MRQRTSEKTAKRYAREAGLDERLVSHALVRGNTNHRVDLFLHTGARVPFFLSERVSADTDTWYPQPWFWVRSFGPGPMWKASG